VIRRISNMNIRSKESAYIAIAVKPDCLLNRTVLSVTDELICEDVKNTLKRR